MQASILTLLNPEQKKIFLQNKVDLSYSTGEIIFIRGELANNMFRVERGKVSLFRLMPNGDEKLFKVFLAGDIFAEVAIFMNPRRYPMSARAEQDSLLSAFSYDSVSTFICSYPELTIKILAFMGNRINQLMDTIDILTQVSANQRLVMKLAEIYKNQQCTQGKLFLPITKKLLATQLGMTPETLSRMIKKLKVDKYVEESGSNLVILDIPNLCRSVDLTDDIFVAEER